MLEDWDRETRVEQNFELERFQQRGGCAENTRPFIRSPVTRLLHMISRGSASGTLYIASRIAEDLVDGRDEI